MQILSVSVFRFQPFQRALKHFRENRGREKVTNKQPAANWTFPRVRQEEYKRATTVTHGAFIRWGRAGGLERAERASSHTHGFINNTTHTTQHSHSAQQGQQHTLHVEAARFGLWLILNGSTMAFQGFKINLNELSTRPAIVTRWRGYCCCILEIGQ